MESTTVSLCIVVCVSTIICESDIERIDSINLPDIGLMLPQTPQSNYLRLGLSNLEKAIPIEEISPTKSYEEDIAKNQELLKFVARNGYQVWKKMLVSPSNSSYFANINTNSTMPSIDNFKSEQLNNGKLFDSHTDMSDTTGNIAGNKEISADLLDAFNNGLSSLIEQPVHLIPVFAKEQSTGETERPITVSTTRKSKRKPKKIQHKISIVHKKKSFFGSSNIIGKVVISGFKGLINGITSLFGWWK